MFRLFDCLDQALVDREKRVEKASRVPAVWPSEASATPFQPYNGSNIIGTCHRKSYWRLTGEKVSAQMDAIGGWKVTTGKRMEETIVDLAQLYDDKLYIANGVRVYAKDIFLPFELDLVVRNPETNQAVIVECKNYSGYQAAKDIQKLGRPKIEHLMQISLYLYEVQTGIKLKRLIQEGLDERQKDPEAAKYRRNRIEVGPTWNIFDDGPVAAKLAYIDRDKCERTEFDISIFTDFDGLHYPAVEGQPYKLFTLESIYDRYKILQNYWFTARKEAVQRLQARGLSKPPKLHLVLSPEEADYTDFGELNDHEKMANANYMEALEDEVRALPESFLPPPEYEFSYSDQKIEAMYAKGEIAKTKYMDWKKGKRSFIGAWQCMYCPHKGICIPRQNPKLGYLINDLQAEAEE